MAEDAATFVRAVMDELGANGPTDLANAMGWGPNSPRKISRWLAGETSPNYEQTMELLGRAGLHGRPGEQRPQPVDAAPRMMQEALDNQRLMRDDLRELSKKVVAISTSMTNALKLLESLAEDGRAQSKPRKRRAG